MIKYDGSEEFDCAIIMTDARTFNRHILKKHSLQPVQFVRGKPRMYLTKEEDIEQGRCRMQWRGEVAHKDDKSMGGGVGGATG